MSLPGPVARRVQAVARPESPSATPPGAATHPPAAPAGSRSGPLLGHGPRPSGQTASVAQRQVEGAGRRRGGLGAPLVPDRTGRPVPYAPELHRPGPSPTSATPPATVPLPTSPAVQRSPFSPDRIDPPDSHPGGPPAAPARVELGPTLGDRPVMRSTATPASLAEPYPPDPAAAAPAGSPYPGLFGSTHPGS
ncbi:MAG: hypothetical protein ACRDY0_04475, partial [Acidimicrobiales bacterium]